MSDHTAAVQAFLAINLDHSPRPVPPRRRSEPDQADRGAGSVELPCRRNDPSLWFAEQPQDLERAKALCAQCPIRLACLSVAVDRGEFAGVWGGHIFDRGRIVAFKRGRGRPRKHRNLCAGSSCRAGAAEENVMPQHRPAVPDHGSKAVRAAAADLYDAECALHTAHQSHVDVWIEAANEKLHDAVDLYIAVATAPQPDESDSSAGFTRAPVALACS